MQHKGFLGFWHARDLNSFRNEGDWFDSCGVIRREFRSDNRFIGLIIVDSDYDMRICVLLLIEEHEFVGLEVIVEIFCCENAILMDLHVVEDWLHVCLLVVSRNVFVPERVERIEIEFFLAGCAHILVDDIKLCEYITFSTYWLEESTVQVEDIRVFMVGTDVCTLEVNSAENVLGCFGEIAFRDF